MRPIPAQRVLGSAVLLLGLCGLVIGVLAVLRSEAWARVVHETGSALQAERDTDLVFETPSTAHIHTGAPVFPFTDQEGTAPLGHVVCATSSASGLQQVRVRLAYGQRPNPAWRLHVLEPSRRLGEAVTKAVPPEMLKEYGESVRARVLALWREALAPDLHSRVPDFLARLDPDQDPQAKRLLDGMGASLVRRLDPLLEDLTGAVRKALNDELGILDRMGLLWKVATGDEKGLERKVLPVARTAAERWWAEHRGQVIQQVGAALRDHADELSAWAGGAVLEAAREELFEPVLAAHRERIESEAEALLREAAQAFVRAPDGSLRVRFAAVVRDTLLGKRAPLLLLEPVQVEQGP